MTMAPQDILYISSNGTFNTVESIQSQVALFVLNFCKSGAFQVVVVHSSLEEDGDITSDLTPAVSSLSLNVNAIEQDRNDQTSRLQRFEYGGVKFQRVIKSEVPEVVKNCPLPVILDFSGQLCLCGLSTVLRRIVLSTNEEQCSENLSSLLGFRQTSLANCAEASIWTKLVDSCIIKDVAEIRQDKGLCDSVSHLPPDSLLILEQKLSVPVSTFNIHHQQRQKSGRDGKLPTSEIALDKVVSDYKTERIIVNKKAYKNAIRAYKKALDEGLIHPGTKFKESEFHISLDSWREKTEKGDENSFHEGDQRRGDVHGNAVKEKERIWEQTLPHTSSASTSTSGFENGVTEGNGDETLVRNEDFCNSKNLEKKSNGALSGKHDGNVSGKRTSSEDNSLLVSASSVCSSRANSDASKVSVSNSPHYSTCKNMNITKRSETSPNIGNHSKSASSQQSASESKLKHHFTEGSSLTLTDLALFLPVHIFVKFFKETKGNFSTLQHLVGWYQRMWCLEEVKRTALEVGLEEVLLDEKFCTTEVDVSVLAPVEYEFGKGRSRKARNHAIKRELPAILSKIQPVLGECSPVDHPCRNSPLDWSAMPPPVSPQHGEVPPDRLLKKHQQIESLVSVVTSLAQDEDTVVDFCSGGGHVGIVIAYLLPRCRIVMIENNEEAIRRAHQRVKMLRLRNVTIFQSNIDYFQKPFHIGVSLHACGVATDIVIDKCVEHRASFVSSPCCYGSINPTNLISYPRSKLFQTIPITAEEILVVAHAAEHTSWEFELEKSKRGKLCMTIVDEDRASYVKEHGYHVTLCSLSPLTCSPKNNLLIGVKGGQPFPPIVPQML